MCILLALVSIKFNLPVKLFLGFRLAFHVCWRLSAYFLFLTYPKSVSSANIDTYYSPCLLSHQYRWCIYTMLNLHSWATSLLILP